MITISNKLFSSHGFLVVYLLTYSFFFNSFSKSEVFTVGDESLWIEGFDYESWAQSHTFHVGDFLEFKYSLNSHNVYEVTKATYRSCDPSTGVLAKYESGDDKVELKESKEYWFICNVDQHCLGGMRFGINVTNTTDGNSFSPPPSSSTIFESPPPSTNAVEAKAGGLSILEAGILLMVIRFVL